jgi:Mn-dependent DtxR family transcriptional regulator
VNHWWRAYNEAVNDPKLQLLSDALFRAWFNVMCIASASDGSLPPLKDIAFTLRIQPTKAAQVLAQLHSAGLLDKTETGFIPHNWNGRQYKSDVSTDRVKRFRNGKRNVSSVTPPETEAETDNAEAKASGADAPRDVRAELFKHGLQTLSRHYRKRPGRLPLVCRQMPESRF